MNIRDNIEECGYCGGKIAKESEKSHSGTGRPDSAVQKGEGAKLSAPLQGEPGSEEEEEGGISVYLQSGEQVIIGSLNIAVKKFYFHAYLTNQRIFLIDTQEKKVKVTAKDIPRDSIAGSTIEFSESSDPVLVLSLKSADDEIKTMKLIFTQDGMDRSDEVNEWISLLHEHEKPGKLLKKTVEESPEPEEKPAPVEQEKPVPKQELQPKRKPAKDHEKQPPVKRHVVFHTMQEEEPEVEEPRPQRRAVIREVPEPVKKPVAEKESYYEISPKRKSDTQPLRKREVQSAMKVAMKNAMQPLKPSALQTAKRPVIEPPSREPEPVDSEETPRRSGIRENVREEPVADEGVDLPLFCQNCGKKIPPAANFCPGCGTKLGVYKASPSERSDTTPREKKTPHHEAPAREKKGAPREEEKDEDEKEDETPVPTKPPVKKVPKGSEMTILHKFLRR